MFDDLAPAGESLSARPYVPLLLDRRGERSALEEFGYQLAPNVAPLVQITPPRLRDGAEQEQPPELWAKALARKVRGNPIYLDVAGARRRTRGERPLSAAAAAAVLDAAGTLGMRFVPVYPLGMHTLAPLVARVADEQRMGVAVRVALDGITVPSGHTLSNVVSAETDRLGLAVSDVDLIVDLGYLDVNLDVDAASVARILDPIDAIAKWRSVVLAAGSVPETLSEAIPDGQFGGIARLEWRLWQDLRQARPWLRFGDYGVQNPVPPDPVNAQYMRASIRYTARDSILAVRGERPVREMSRDEKEAEYRGLAMRVYEHPWFVDCCAADRFIVDCADGRLAVRTQQEWRSVSTLHHLSTLAESIAAVIGSTQIRREQPVERAAGRQVDRRRRRGQRPEERVEA